MSDQRHQLSKTFISNVELEAIKKKNADLQFCLDKEVARVMELTQQSSKLQSRVDFLNEQNSAQQEQNADLLAALTNIRDSKDYAGAEARYLRLLAGEAIAKAGEAK